MHNAAFPDLPRPVSPQLRLLEQNYTIPSILLYSYEEAYTSKGLDALRAAVTLEEAANTYFGSVPAAALRKRCLLCLIVFL